MTAPQLPDGTWWEHRGRTFRGSVRPGGRTVLLVSPEPTEGFSARPAGGWSLEVPREDAVRVTLRTTCRWRGEPFQVMATEGEQLVLRHLGSSGAAREMGLTEVDRGVFNATVPASEVTDLEQAEHLAPELRTTSPEAAVAAVLRWTGTDDQATEGRWRADPFREGWLVVRPTKRRGAPLFLVRGGLVRPVNLAHETLEEAWERMPEA